MGQIAFVIPKSREGEKLGCLHPKFGVATIIVQSFMENILEIGERDDHFRMIRGAKGWADLSQVVDQT
jgi:hypothetical protein